MDKEKAEEITAKRRIDLFNAKARNVGFRDFFGKDKKKEKDLNIEREKLLVGIKYTNPNIDVDKQLLKPGEKNEEHGADNAKKE